MCTAAQYFEVEGVILDLNSSYCGGWVEPMVLRIPQYFDKATWGCIWGSQMNAGARHDRIKCECGAQSEGCWVRSQGGLYISMELDRFTVVKGNKYASLAPKVGSVSEIHISHKETRYCGCRRVGFW